MRLSHVVLAGLLVTLAPAVAGAADTIAVLPVSGINVHPGYLDAAQALLKRNLARTGRYTVVSVAGQAAAEPSGAQAAQAAQAAGASLAAALQVTRLQNRAEVHLSVYRVPDGALVHEDQLGAASPDDLDAVLARLADGLASGRPARSNANIETVTEREAMPHLKRHATHVVGLALGGLVVANRAGSDGNPAVPGGSLFWLYDARSYLAEVSLFLSGKDGAGAGGIRLGAYYPFGSENMTPYVGGGLQWMGTRFGGAGASGLAPYVAGGILLGRLSTVQVRGELGYFVTTFGEKEDGYYDSRNNTYVEPSGSHISHGLMLSAGLGF